MAKMAGGGPDCRHTTLKETKEFIRTKLTPVISFDEALRQVGLPRPGKMGSLLQEGIAMKRALFFLFFLSSASPFGGLTFISSVVGLNRCKPKSRGTDDGILAYLSTLYPR